MPLAALVAHSLNVEPAVDEEAPTVSGPLRDRVRVLRTVRDSGLARYTVAADGVDTIRPARVTDGGRVAISVTVTATERLSDTAPLRILISSSFAVRRIGETAAHAVTTRHTSVETPRDAYESEIWLLHGYID